MTSSQWKEQGSPALGGTKETQMGAHQPPNHQAGAPTEKKNVGDGDLNSVLTGVEHKVFEGPSLKAIFRYVQKQRKRLRWMGSRRSPVVEAGDPAWGES